MKIDIGKRLDLMDVEIQTILKRQAYLLAAIATIARTPDQLKQVIAIGDEMVGTLDDIVKKIQEFVKENEDAGKVGKAE